MADELIKRRDLVRHFNNLRKGDWERATRKLNLIWDDEHGKGPHSVIRDPNFPNPSDTRGLIATVQKGLYYEANQSIFKNLRRKGIGEDDIWKALGMI